MALANHHLYRGHSLLRRIPSDVRVRPVLGAAGKLLARPHQNSLQTAPVSWCAQAAVTSRIVFPRASVVAQASPMATAAAPVRVAARGPGFVSAGRRRHPTLERAPLTVGGLACRRPLALTRHTTSQSMCVWPVQEAPTAQAGSAQKRVVFVVGGPGSGKGTQVRGSSRVDPCGSYGTGAVLLPLLARGASARYWARYESSRLGICAVTVNLTPPLYRPFWSPSPPIITKRSATCWRATLACRSSAPAS